MKAIAVRQPWAEAICAEVHLHVSLDRDLDALPFGEAIAIWAWDDPASDVPEGLIASAGCEYKPLPCDAVVATFRLDYVARVARVRSGGEDTDIAFFDPATRRPADRADVPLSTWVEPYSDWSPGRWIVGIGDVWIPERPVFCSGGAGDVFDLPAAAAQILADPGMAWRRAGDWH